MGVLEEKKHSHSSQRLRWWPFHVACQEGGVQQLGMTERQTPFIKGELVSLRGGVCAVMDILLRVVGDERRDTKRGS